MDKRHEETFHQNGYPDGKKEHGRMFIISHWGNTNENPMSYHHTPMRMEKIKILIPANAVEEARCRKTRSLTHPQWECKRVWQLLEKTTTQLLYFPETALLGIYSREKYPYVHIKTCTQTAVLTGNNSDVCTSMEEWFNTPRIITHQ